MLLDKYSLCALVILLSLSLVYLFFPLLPTFTPCQESPILYSAWKSKKPADPPKTLPGSQRSLQIHSRQDLMSQRLVDSPHLSYAIGFLPLLTLSPKSLVKHGQRCLDVSLEMKVIYPSVIVFCSFVFNPTGSFWSVDSPDSFHGQCGFLSRFSAASLGRLWWQSSASTSSRVRPPIVNRARCRFGSSPCRLEQGCQVTC